MKRTEIINKKIVNWVAQMASLLKSGDVFRKPRGSTHYKFVSFDSEQKLVICENIDTHVVEEIYANSPVYRLLIV
jgi:hypothetical protein